MRDQQVLLRDYHIAPDVLWTAVKNTLTTLDGSHLTTQTMPR